MHVGDLLEDLWLGGMMFLKKQRGRVWAGHISFVTGTTERANEHSGFIQNKQFLQKLKDRSLLK